MFDFSSLGSMFSGGGVGGGGGVPPNPFATGGAPPNPFLGGSGGSAPMNWDALGSLGSGAKSLAAPNITATSSQPTPQFNVNLSPAMQAMMTSNALRRDPGPANNEYTPPRFMR